MVKKQNTGLIIVYTGKGKGKTSAALGATIRASGHGWKCYILQFIKGSWHYGEMDGIKPLAPNVIMEQMGKGFYKIIDDKIPGEEHKKAARNALERARETMHSGEYQLVVLDEINYAVDLGLLPLDDVVALLQKKPGTLHVILTGRNAPHEIIELADMVTEMKEVKYPFQKDLKSRKGIDF